MTRPMTLAQWADAGYPDKAKLVVASPDAETPLLVKNLHKLHRLGFLTDQTFWSLIGQAPVDPIGLFGALQPRGRVWAFNALDFTVVTVLAQSKKNPIALMRIDLLSDDVTFIALADGELAEHHRLTADEIAMKIREPGMTEVGMLKWLDDHAKRAVDAGMGGQ